MQQLPIASQEQRLNPNIFWPAQAILSIKKGFLTDGFSEVHPNGFLSQNLNQYIICTVLPLLLSFLSLEISC